VASEAVSTVFIFKLSRTFLLYWLNLVPNVLVLDTFVVDVVSDMYHSLMAHKLLLGVFHSFGKSVCITNLAAFDFAFL
jgi:hypothetical protein